MIGVLLLSHSDMAQGMLNSAKLFFGDDIPAIGAEGLYANDSPEAFDERIKAQLEKLDDGHGVLILCALKNF